MKKGCIDSVTYCLMVCVINVCMIQDVWGLGVGTMLSNPIQSSQSSHPIFDPILEQQIILLKSPTKVSEIIPFLDQIRPVLDVIYTTKNAYDINYYEVKYDLLAYAHGLQRFIRQQNNVPSHSMSSFCQAFKVKSHVVDRLLLLFEVLDSVETETHLKEVAVSILCGTPLWTEITMIQKEVELFLTTYTCPLSIMIFLSSHMEHPSVASLVYRKAIYFLHHINDTTYHFPEPLWIKQAVIEKLVLRLKKYFPTQLYQEKDLPTSVIKTLWTENISKNLVSGRYTPNINWHQTWHTFLDHKERALALAEQAVGQLSLGDIMILGDYFKQTHDPRLLTLFRKILKHYRFSIWPDPETPATPTRQSLKWVIMHAIVNIFQGAPSDQVLPFFLDELFSIYEEPMINAKLILKLGYLFADTEDVAVRSHIEHWMNSPIPFIRWSARYAKLEITSDPLKKERMNVKLRHQVTAMHARMRQRVQGLEQTVTTALDFLLHKRSIVGLLHMRSQIEQGEQQAVKGRIYHQTVNSVTMWYEQRQTQTERIDKGKILQQMPERINFLCYKEVPMLLLSDMKLQESVDDEPVNTTFLNFFSRHPNRVSYHTDMVLYRALDQVRGDSTSLIRLNNKDDHGTIAYNTPYQITLDTSFVSHGVKLGVLNDIVNPYVEPEEIQQALRYWNNDIPNPNSPYEFAKSEVITQIMGWLRSGEWSLQCYYETLLSYYGVDHLSEINDPTLRKLLGVLKLVINHYDVFQKSIPTHYLLSSDISEIDVAAFYDSVDDKIYRVTPALDETVRQVALEVAS